VNLNLNATVDLDVDDHVGTNRSASGTNRCRGVNVNMIALAVIALSGCNYVTDSFVVNEFSGDPFPTTIETTSGAMVLGMGEPSQTIHTAVLDVMSPFTVIDDGVNTQPRIDNPQVVLYGERSPGAAFDLPRAEIDAPDVMTIHPCDAEACSVGTPAVPRPYDAIVGMNAFAGDALRLHLATDPTVDSDLIYLLPDIAGSEPSRTYSCDAVFPSPYRGGGTAIVGGTELPFSNTRIAIDACLAPNPDPLLLQSQRGVDVLFVASTAIGVSLLDRSAYERYRALVTTAPAYDDLLDDSVLLPSGPIAGKRTNIATLDFAGKSTSNPRSPCRQVYASRYMIQHDCLPGDDCPCTSDAANSGTYCGVPAIIELAPPTGFDVLIVDDNDPTLQALRTELRPDQPEVDGILGTNAIRELEIDLDQPNGRLLGRCQNALDKTTCAIRPEILNDVSKDNRVQVAGCIGPITTPPGVILH
jgi:hypothetical protein